MVLAGEEAQAKARRLMALAIRLGVRFPMKSAYLAPGAVSMDVMGCISQAVALQFRGRLGAVFSASPLCSTSNNIQPRTLTHRPRK